MLDKTTDNRIIIIITIILSPPRFLQARELWGPFLESSGNLAGPISIFLNVFFANYTVNTDRYLVSVFIEL